MENLLEVPAKPYQAYQPPVWGGDDNRLLKRTEPTIISAKELQQEFFGGKNQTQRLSNSYTITEIQGSDDITLWGLPEFKVGKGCLQTPRKSICRLCIMQLAAVRCGEPLLVGATVTYQPSSVSPSLYQVKIDFNDAMGEDADTLRAQYFIPGLDATLYTNKKISRQKQQELAYRHADLAARRLLPLLFEHPSVNLKETAESLRLLDPIVSWKSAKRALGVAGAAADAAVSTGSTIEVRNAAIAAADAVNLTSCAANVAREAVSAAEAAATVLGWDTVFPLYEREFSARIIWETTRCKELALTDPVIAQMYNEGELQ